MSGHEERLIRFLSDPAAYPHPVDAVLRRETHVSHVFLAGDFAYKLKKPLRFPFLDASSLARRERFCRLELSLNRRLAPAVYLGMVPIWETPEGLRLGRSGQSLSSRRSRKGRVIEWLVRMRRLPEARMLDRLVAHRAVSGSDMERIADRLARFFREAKRGPAISRYGRPAAVAALVLGNLEECRPFLGSLFSEAERGFLESAFRQYLTLYEPLLAQRLREGRTIDGHGDLRCENICLWSPSIKPKGDILSEAEGRVEGTTGVSIFDCVEFEPAFRCGDVANDFGFLVMDVEFRARDDLAQALVARYRYRLHDPTLGQVLSFYKCHRSLVRGKVRGLAFLQHPRTREGRYARELSRRHFRLALRYARAFAPPRLILIGGLIGSGKSTLARSLSRSLGAVWLRTDEIRRSEFAHTRQRRQRFGEGLYAPRVSERVYRRLIRRSEALLRQGRSVVCDGTFSKASGREALRAIAERCSSSFHFFECVVPKAVALRRIAKRCAAGGDLSEARPEHYDRLEAEFEPVDGWSWREQTRLSDNRPSSATCHAALEILRRAWLPHL